MVKENKPSQYRLKIHEIQGKIREGQKNEITPLHSIQKFSIHVFFTSLYPQNSHAHQKIINMLPPDSVVFQTSGYYISSAHTKLSTLIASFEMQAGIYTSRYFVHPKRKDQMQRFNQIEKPVIWTNSITRNAILKFPDWIDFFRNDSVLIKEGFIPDYKSNYYEILFVEEEEKKNTALETISDNYNKTNFMSATLRDMVLQQGKVNHLQIREPANNLLLEKGKVDNTSKKYFGRHSSGDQFEYIFRKSHHAYFDLCISNFQYKEDCPEDYYCLQSNVYEHGTEEEKSESFLGYVYIFGVIGKEEGSKTKFSRVLGEKEFPGWYQDEDRDLCLLAIYECQEGLYTCIYECNDEVAGKIENPETTNKRIPKDVQAKFLRMWDMTTHPSLTGLKLEYQMFYTPIDSIEHREMFFYIDSAKKDRDKCLRISQKVYENLCFAETKNKSYRVRFAGEMLNGIEEKKVQQQSYVLRDKSIYGIRPYYLEKSTVKNIEALDKRRPPFSLHISTKIEKNIVEDNYWAVRVNGFDSSDDKYKEKDLSGYLYLYIGIPNGEPEGKKNLENFLRQSKFPGWIQDNESVALLSIHKITKEGYLTVFESHARLSGNISRIDIGSKTQIARPYMKLLDLGKIIGTNSFRYYFTHSSEIEANKQILDDLNEIDFHESLTTKLCEKTDTLVAYNMATECFMSHLELQALTKKPVIKSMQVYNQNQELDGWKEYCVQTSEFEPVDFDKNHPPFDLWISRSIVKVSDREKSEYEKFRKNIDTADSLVTQARKFVEEEKLELACANYDQALRLWWSSIEQAKEILPGEISFTNKFAIDEYFFSGLVTGFAKIVSEYICVQTYISPEEAVAKGNEYNSLWKKLNVKNKGIWLDVSLARGEAFLLVGDVINAIEVLEEISNSMTSLESRIYAMLRYVPVLISVNKPNRTRVETKLDTVNRVNIARDRLESLRKELIAESKEELRELEPRLAGGVTSEELYQVKDAADEIIKRRDQFCDQIDLAIVQTYLYDNPQQYIRKTNEERRSIDFHNYKDATQKYLDKLVESKDAVVSEQAHLYYTQLNLKYEKYNDALTGLTYLAYRYSKLDERYNQLLENKNITKQEKDWLKEEKNELKEIGFSAKKLLIRQQIVFLKPILQFLRTNYDMMDQAMENSLPPVEEFGFSDWLITLLNINKVAENTFTLQQSDKYKQQIHETKIAEIQRSISGLCWLMILMQLSLEQADSTGMCWSLAEIADMNPMEILAIINKFPEKIRGLPEQYIVKRKNAHGETVEYNGKFNIADDICFVLDNDEIEDIEFLVAGNIGQIQDPETAILQWCRGELYYDNDHLINLVFDLQDSSRKLGNFARNLGKIAYEESLYDTNSVWYLSSGLFLRFCFAISGSYLYLVDGAKDFYCPSDEAWSETGLVGKLAWYTVWLFDFAASPFAAPFIMFDPHVDDSRRSMAMVETALSLTLYRSVAVWTRGQSTRVTKILLRNKAVKEGIKLEAKNCPKVYQRSVFFQKLDNLKDALTKKRGMRYEDIIREKSAQTFLYVKELGKKSYKKLDSWRSKSDESVPKKSRGCKKQDEDWAKISKKELDAKQVNLEKATANSYLKMKKETVIKMLRQEVKNFTKYHNIFRDQITSLEKKLAEVCQNSSVDGIAKTLGDLNSLPGMEVEKIFLNNNVLSSSHTITNNFLHSVDIIMTNRIYLDRIQIKCHNLLCAAQKNASKIPGDVQSFVKNIGDKVDFIHISSKTTMKDLKNEMTKFSIMVDSTNKKVFFGKNNGGSMRRSILERLENYKIPQALREVEERIMAMETWRVGSCAESDTLRQVLANGSKIQDLVVGGYEKVVDNGVVKYLPVCACLNCTQMLRTAKLVITKTHLSGVEDFATELSKYTKYAKHIPMRIPKFAEFKNTEKYFLDVSLSGTYKLETPEGKKYSSPKGKRCIEFLKQKGYFTNNEVEAFLENYGGLYMEIPHHAIPTVVNYFIFDPEYSNLEEVNFASKKLNTKLFPIGKGCREYTSLAIDSYGSIIALSSGSIFLLGGSFSEAVSNICNGKKVEEIGE